jgi:hypothetical protein
VCRIIGSRSASVCTEPNHDELSTKAFFKSSHLSMESDFKLLSHVRGADSSAIRKYMTLVLLLPPETSTVSSSIGSTAMGLACHHTC